MSKTTQEKIELIKREGYQIDFGTIFNNAFENYKKIAMYAGLMIFVFAVLFGIVATGVVIYTYGITVLNQKMLEDLQVANFTGFNLIMYFVMATLLSCLFAPFFAGLIKMAHSADKDEEFHVSTVFQYYKSPYFQELIIATIVISVFNTTLVELLNYSGIKLLGGIFSFFISFLTFLTVPLIIFGKLKALDAIKSSILLVSKQPLVLFGLIIISSIAGLVGFIGCCIGVFFTLPFIYSMYYSIYDAIIGVESVNDTE